MQTYRRRSVQITNFKVSFSRSVQPASYESAKAEVEFAGIIDDGENPAQMTANALALAKRQALAAVGKGSPKSDTDVQTIDTAPAVEPEVIVPKKRGKGRPKTKEVLQAEAAAAMADDAQDEAVAALEQAADVPYEEAEITDKEIQDAANASAKKHGGKVVKTLMVEKFGVQMLRDITVGDRPKFLKALAGLDKA